MRARNIKPGFFRSEIIAELPFEFRLLFIGLWIICDRNGRCENRPKRIRMEIFPADDVDIEKGLAALQAVGLIRLYSENDENGSDFIDIPSFLKHQRPHPRECPSAIPPHPKATPRHDPGNTKALPSPSDVLNVDIPISASHPGSHLGNAQAMPRSCPQETAAKAGGNNPPTTHTTRKGQHWRTDESAAMAKGKALGIEPKRGEDFETYRQRIATALHRQ